jgi:hypothetical protein
MSAVFFLTPPRLAIDHVITADAFDGEPWPPNAAGPWVAVARSRGFTKWRRVRISRISLPPLVCVR